MLQQFTVENFLSFKDKEVFKLQPGKGSRNKGHKVEPVKGYWILKSAALFGPNAGGKSNFVDELEKIEAEMEKVDEALAQNEYSPDYIKLNKEYNFEL